MSPIICIEVSRRGEPVGQGSSPGPHCFVGKDEGSVVPLTGWRIGRRQLAFSMRDDGLHLADAGGMAPVRVNGNDVRQYGPLAANDEIALGDYTVRARLRSTPDPVAVIDGVPAPASNPAPILGALENPDGMLLRAALHRKLIGAMDLRRVNVARMADAELRAAVQKLIEELIDTDDTFSPLRALREELRDVVLNEIVGLGPLEALLADE